MAGGSWSRVESAFHAFGGLGWGVGGCESTVLPEEEVAGESGHVSRATVVGWSVSESSEANDGCWNMPMSSGVGVGDSSEIVVSHFECWGGYSDRAWELNNSSSES
jgi:hypothetical protein